LDGLWVGLLAGLSAKRVSLGSGKDSGCFADPEDRSREGREDHVGLLKLEMPANVVQDSNGADLSDMTNNPT
jgi:hypothetical protein